jgi:predicted Ser/Thr protein kinase
LLELALPRAKPAPASEIQVRTRAEAPRLEVPTQDEIAQALPDLDGLALLGRGGMGVVYKARQKQLDRWVALKVLPRALGADPAFRERFLREARALARLRHPNIVAVHEFGEAGGLFYLVMELVDGVDLRHVMRERRLAPREALAIVRELCDALQYAHDEGIVHRDIKPENVIVDRTGGVKIADFGLAKVAGLAAGANLTEAGTVMGTPHYMAPEQLERPDEVDHRADLFALGVVLYEMLTGSLPRGAYEPPSRRIEVDVRLDEIVLKALEREPARRYQQALEVKSDVARVDAAPQRVDRDSQREPHEVSQGVRVDPLRGARGFALCAAFWIVTAVLWNLGPFAFGVSFTGLCVLASLLLHHRLQARPQLAAVIAAEGKIGKVLRSLSTIAWLGAGLALVILAHFMHWERGTTAWVPAFPAPNGQLDAWRLDPFGLVRLAGAIPAPDQDIAVRAIAVRMRVPLVISPWPVFAAGFALLVVALYLAVRPRAHASARREAWGVASAVGVHLVGSLVVLWLLASVPALRMHQRLAAVERRFTIEGEPDHIARVLQAALANKDLEIDVDQRIDAVDARSNAPVADAHILRAAATSPFDRWSTSPRGPERRSPQIWVAVARAVGASESQVVLRAGLYEAGSKRGEDAHAELAELEAAARAD